MTDHRPTARPTVTHRPRLLAQAAALGAVALALLPQPAAAQERIEGATAGMDYALTMPEGWGRFDRTMFFTRDDGGRVVAIHAFGENQLQVRHFQGAITVHEAALAGLETQVFTGLAQNAFLPVFPERVDLRGTRQLHYFGLCGDAGSAETPTAYAVELISGEEFSDATADPHFAPVLELLALTLPEGAEPCPAELASRLNATPAARAVAEGGLEFERMGLTIELPAEFGEPQFEFDFEIVWFDEAMRNEQPGIGVLVATAPTREDVLGELRADGEIHARRKVTFTPGGFERMDFMMQQEGVAGVMFISDEPYHDENIVVVLIATPPENLDAARDRIEAIAARIEAANSGE